MSRLCPAFAPCGVLFDVVLVAEEWPKMARFQVARSKGVNKLRDILDLSRFNDNSGTSLGIGRGDLRRDMRDI